MTSLVRALTQYDCVPIERRDGDTKEDIRDAGEQKKNTMGTDNKRVAICTPRREASEDTKSVGTLTLCTQPPEL